MNIVSFNVNSINVRLPIVLEFLQDNKPDVLLLQELKCEEQKFPREVLEDAGYNVYVCGQKTYNGVAILSRKPLSNIITNIMPDDNNARYIQGELDDGMVVASLYLPNGDLPDLVKLQLVKAKATLEQKLETLYATEKFQYKLKFMDFLHEHITGLVASEQPFIIGGDYNVIFKDKDTHNIKSFEGTALLNPKVRDKFQNFLNAGAIDTLDVARPNEVIYSWYSYKGQAAQNGKGILIDHFLVSPDFKDKISDCYVDTKTRAQERPSDHVPLILYLN